MNDDRKHRGRGVVRVPRGSVAVFRASLVRRGLDLVKQPSEVTIWEPDGSEMVYIPEGEFLRGDDREPFYVAGFWIDKYPVTNSRYKRFVDATGHREPRVPWLDWDEERGTYPPAEANHPVVFVSWHDAVAYCEWAGKRLPTEWEWEKAARGTDGRTYPWGEDWVDWNSTNRELGATTPVDMYPQGASPYGVMDMSGNVHEWTSILHANSPTGRKDSLVLRGSCWDDSPDDVRCARRFSFLYSTLRDPRFEIVGFRCARSC